MRIGYNAGMEKHTYGHRPPEIGPSVLGSGWISGIRHLASRSAKGSFWHRHAETSVICCLRGEYVYELHGLSPITLTTGSYLVVPAQVEHRHLKAVDPVGDKLEKLLSPELARTSRHTVFDPKSCKALHATLLKQALRPVKCSKELLSSCHELYALSGRAAQGLTQDECALARLLCQLILYRMTHSALPTPQRAAVPFDKIASWIESHLSERIDIDRLVSRVGYSRTQVFTIFRENAGLTPAAFLTRLRVQKARELLETTDWPAARIAERCGFSAASVFNAVFRRQTGMTPLDWRLRHLPYLRNATKMPNAPRIVPQIVHQSESE